MARHPLWPVSALFGAPRSSGAGEPAGAQHPAASDRRGRRFRDRIEAGEALAVQLARYADVSDAIVLALPRGGVPVGRVLADRLRLPLDAFLVRKLGVPGHEEFAFGALAAGGSRVLNQDVIRSLHLSPDVIDQVTAAEQRELDRRMQAYRGDLPPPVVRGRTIILVDDGLATGSTMAAAVMALRQLAPKRIVVAVPVGAPEIVDGLRAVADEVECAIIPQALWSVGAWYEDFGEVSDEEVRTALGGGPGHRP